jgi:hypothetical protein
MALQAHYLIISYLHVQMSGPNKAPFSGVSEDLKGRAACYKQDWNHGFRSGLRFAQHQHAVIA